MNETLVTDNINLVYGILHKRYSRFAHDEDLAQQGMIGLIYAADTFNDSKGATFSTYATKCILNEIRKEFVRRCGQAKTISFEGDEETSLENILFTDGGLEEVERSQTFYDFSKDQLNDTERLILRMKRADMSSEEIAKSVGLSASGVRKKLRRIKRLWGKWKNEVV